MGEEEEEEEEERKGRGKEGRRGMSQEMLPMQSSTAQQYTTLEAGRKEGSKEGEVCRGEQSP